MNSECHVEPIEKNISPETAAAARSATLAVWGMGCINCANRVRNSLLGLDGVVSTGIDLQRGLAYVDYLPTQVGLHDLILAVAAAGNDGRHEYRAVPIS